MGQADTQYRKAVTAILEKGIVDKPENVRPVYEDGEKATTKALFNLQMRYDNSGNEALLLTTKEAPRKDPNIELLWIWQKMSNNVQELRDMGCKVWNEWEMKDGTIGSAYGHQLKTKKQKVIVDKLYIEMYLNGEFSNKPGIMGVYGKLGEEEYEDAKEKMWDMVGGEEIWLNQVDFLLYSLKNNPHSRSIITTLFAVEDLDNMALKPCVYETQWKVFGDRLNLAVGVRSNDMALTY